MPNDPLEVAAENEQPNIKPAINPIPEPNKRVREDILTTQDLKNVGFGEKEIEELSKKSAKEKESLFVQKSIDTWGHTLNAPRLPLWLKGTGNVKVINQMLNTYGPQFSTKEKAFLLRHREVTAKIEQANDLRNKQIEEGNLPEDKRTRVEIADDGRSAFLPDVHLNEFQTSPNGCWSVSMMLQLQAKGIKFSQEEIRDFRPSHENGADARKTLQEGSQKEDKKRRSMAAKTDQAYHSNQGNNYLEMGDAIVSMAPDSMIHEVSYTGYDAQIRQLGISRTQYIDNVTNDLQKTILHAIKEDRSPVSFLKGGHYLTITGIDKDNNVTLKDSQPGYGRGPDDDIKMPLRQLVSRMIGRQIQVSWLGDINLSKDGKTLYGIPSKYAEMNPDGTINEQPGDLNSVAKGEMVLQNVVGTPIYRNGADEDKLETLQNGVIKAEKAYIPKKLNVASLTLKAQKRSPEEERHLQEVSGSFYNVDTEHRPSKESYHATHLKAIAAQDEKEAAERLAAEGRMLDKIKRAKQAAPANAKKIINGRESDADQYIDTLLNTARLQPSKNDKLTSLAKAVLAVQYKESGRSIPQNGFSKAQADQCRWQLKFHTLTEGQINAAIEDPVALKTARDFMMSDAYRVPEERVHNYIKDMQELSKVIKPKEKRSPEYQRFFDAVKKAGEIDQNSPDAADRVAEANQELMKSITGYIKDKEKVRFGTGGQQRFNNAMDALSLVYMYTPTMTDRIRETMNGINKKRDVKKVTSPDYVEVTKFGLERAQADHKKRVKEARKDVKTDKTQQKAAAPGKN
ncbi:MAG: hypothetical protein IKR58_01715 [Lachnospiraceae bacterium]|nr:hypothetical protein [Lachnospiraceae bacterium]